MNVAKCVLLLAAVATVSPATAKSGSLIALDDGIASLASSFNHQQARPWGKTASVPYGMVKQLFFYTDEENGPSFVFFPDFRQALRGGDWIKDVASAIILVTGQEPKKRSKPSVRKPTGDEEGGVLGEITVLSGSMEPLREHFNAHKNKHRFIAILSPT